MLLKSEAVDVRLKFTGIAESENKENWLLKLLIFNKTRLLINRTLLILLTENGPVILIRSKVFVFS